MRTTRPVLTSAIVIGALAAALTSAAPHLADVEPLMARFLADSDVVGVSVGVERGSEVFVRGGWGLTDRGTGRKATAETVYRLGSSSKQFTAALVMKLVERGVVGLDDPVDRHLPQMPRKWLGITIRQLLNHTSGVPNFTDAGSSHWAKKLSPAGLLALVSGHGLRFPPGSKYAYSNSNYVMLGQIAERHYGKPFAQILADEHIQCRKRRGDRPDIRAKRLDVHRSAEALTEIRQRAVRLTACTLAAAVREDCQGRGAMKCTANLPMASPLKWTFGPTKS